ncbi:hypothetical protein PRIPAC_96525 [Pristionchus pacificus]|uniref:Uncharacterized protein n=1 Tax=Pristionchus pacificus TaxID=54126 RepID=A0A2A6BDK9_PRIPA|nr:hypothetical protein PRIPAC_96525 [Pristionchus pacificus]|eukprot:PDM63964.1 hypothetical protein PRIPAC_49465 [Pristionchus pacificus]
MNTLVYMHPSSPPPIPPTLPPPTTNPSIPFFNTTTLIIGYVSLYFPFEYISETGKRKGVLPDMWEQLRMLVFEADRPTRPTWNINTYLIFTRWYMETALFLWIVISFIITELRKMMKKNKNLDMKKEKDEMKNWKKNSKKRPLRQQTHEEQLKIFGRDSPTVLSNYKLIYAELAPMAIDDFEQREYYIIIFDELIVINELNKKQMNNISRIIEAAYNKDYEKTTEGESTYLIGTCKVSRGQVSIGSKTTWRVQILEDNNNSEDKEEEEEEEPFETLTVEDRRKRAIIRYVFGGMARSIILNNNVQFARLVPMYDNTWELQETHVIIINDVLVMQNLQSTQFTRGERTPLRTFLRLHPDDDVPSTSSKSLIKEVSDDANNREGPCSSSSQFFKQTETRQDDMSIELSVMVTESSFIHCPNMVLCLELARTNPKVIALVDKYVYLQYRMDRNAPPLRQIMATTDTPSLSDNLNKFITGIPMGFPTSLLLPVKRHNMFMEILNTQYNQDRIMIEVEKSLPGKLFVQYKRVNEEAKKPKGEQTKALAFANVEFPFYLLAGGLIAAIIFFAVENLYCRYEAKKNQRSPARISRSSLITDRISNV